MATDSNGNRELRVVGRERAMVVDRLVTAFLKPTSALDHLALNSGVGNQRSEDLKSILSLEQVIKQGFDFSYLSIFFQYYKSNPTS